MSNVRESYFVVLTMNASPDDRADRKFSEGAERRS